MPDGLRAKATLCIYTVKRIRNKAVIEIHKRGLLDVTKVTAVEMRNKEARINVTLKDLMKEMIESTYAKARFQLPTLYMAKGIFQIKISNG
jgi:hypothetical protein